MVEVASELTAFAGRLFADLGAEVVLVEPPGGHHTRAYEPFVADERGPERSLWFWHYNASKKSVVLDITGEDGSARFRRLAGSADIVLEGERPGHLESLGLGDAEIRAAHPMLIWVSLTPFGRAGQRAQEPAVDLTLLAGAGPVWSCGYDDHDIPPVRGGGGQALHIGGVHGVMAGLTALAFRDIGGTGQLMEVSVHAAANVTTEAGTLQYLTQDLTVQRQTGRHAAPKPTMETQVLAADGRWVNTGIGLRSSAEFRLVADWISDIGLRDEFPEMALLDLALEEQLGPANPLMLEIMIAGRAALQFLAAQMPAYEFFLEAQRRGHACGVIYAPEDAVADANLQARGLWTDVRHEDFGSYTTVASPFLVASHPRVGPTRAPRVGEHDEEVLEEHPRSAGER